MCQFLHKFCFSILSMERCAMIKCVFWNLYCEYLYRLKCRLVKEYFIKKIPSNPIYFDLSPLFCVIQRSVVEVKSSLIIFVI